MALALTTMWNNMNKGKKAGDLVMVLIEKALALALTTSCVHVLHSQECLIFCPYLCATLSMYYIHKNV